MREKQGSVKRNCWDTAPDSVRRVTVAVTTTIDTVRARRGSTIADRRMPEGVQDVALAVARCVAGEVQAWRFTLLLDAGRGPNLADPETGADTPVRGGRHAHNGEHVWPPRPAP